METDFRAYFLLVETIIKIWLLKNIPARGSLFMVRETDFPVSGNHFFLYFSVKTDFSASGDQFFPFSYTAVNCYQWK